mgnify:FL=1
MAKKNIMNNTTKELVKVDMNSTWAKEVLLPALKHLRESGEAWTIIKAPLELINEFEGQRGYKHSLSYILSNFDYKRVEVKSLNFKDGCLTCWDGKHTIKGLEIMGYKTAWFRLFDNLSTKEEVRLFCEQSKGVTRLTPADAFNCCRQLGVEPAKSILEVCDKYNVTVCEKKKALRNVTAPRKLMQIFDEFGKEGLDYALGIIELSGWADHDSKAYVEASLNVGYQAFKLYGSDLIKTVKLTNELKKYPNSTEFIDVQRKTYNDRSTKHPEGCMGQFVKDLLGK